MRTRSLSCLSKVCWMFPLIVLLIMGYNTTGADAALRSTLLATDAHITKETPDFSKFADTWYYHGEYLRIGANGQAHYGARVYTSCGPGVPQPCDPALGGGAFGNGYQADIQFSQISGNVASGTIISGNVLPVGTSVTATLLPNDQLSFSGVASTGSSRLCGSNAPSGVCGA